MSCSLHKFLTQYSLQHGVNCFKVIQQLAIFLCY